MNKRQIPNGSKNTVNALRQAQQPLNIRKWGNINGTI
jgi:hypothetical protein